MTPLREKMLQCIQEYIAAHGYAPDARQLAELVGVGSLETITLNIKWLVDNGYLVRPHLTYVTMRVLKTV